MFLRQVSAKRELEIFEQCVRKGVAFEQISDNLRRAEKAAVQQNLLAGRIRILRLETESADAGIRFWTALNVGDRIIHTLKNGEAVDTPMVGKIINDQAALSLGNTNQNNELGLMLLLGEPESHFDGAEFLERLFEIHDADDLGFVRVPAEVYAKFLHSGFGNKPFREKGDSSKQKTHWEVVLDASDQYRPQVYRPEQQRLRNMLIGEDPELACALCGKTFPSDFLVTAHIKKRSQAVSEERRDRSIVMPVCTFGCDELFEQSFICVNNRGEFAMQGKKALTTAVLTYIAENFEGKQCWWWVSHPDSRKYFDFHYAEARMAHNV